MTFKEYITRNHGYMEVTTQKFFLISTTHKFKNLLQSFFEDEENNHLEFEADGNSIELIQNDELTYDLKFNGQMEMIVDCSEDAFHHIDTLFKRNIK